MKYGFELKSINILENNRKAISLYRVVILEYMRSSETFKITSVKLLFILAQLLHLDLQLCMDIDFLVL